jgi:hypothetical protein
MASNKGRRINMRKKDEGEHYVRVLVPMPPELAARVKKFWHQRELQSSAEAVRHLVREGFRSIAETERKLALAEERHP